MTTIGVPMMPGDGTANHMTGPEDALAPGAKRGVYAGRIGPNGYFPHLGDDAQRKYGEGSFAVVAPAVGTAGNDATTTVGSATAAGTVARVVYVPNADITGVATNNRKLDFKVGSTVAATISFNAGVNAVKGEPLEIPLSGTPGNLAVTGGAALTWVSTHIATGITDPGGMVYVSIGVAGS